MARFLLLVACASCEPGAHPSAKSSASGVQPAPLPAFPRRFVDITKDSGITFVHFTGANGEKLLPETIGSGAAFLDYDRDGKLDLFFVNSTDLPGHERHNLEAASCALYRGNGDGTFEDVSRSAGADITLYGMGCAVADYDGDEDIDIFVTAVGDNVLLRNEGGAFRDVTAEAGVAGGQWRDHRGNLHPEWSTAALWADFDLDGDVDLFVANYVEWTPEIDIFTTLDGSTKVFTTPEMYRGLPCRLFLNRGDGSFEDGTARAGLLDLKGKALGASLWDFDGNGRLDIVVANDTRPNFFFFNYPPLRFEERGLLVGIAYDSSGRARAGMGIDVADFARDGIPGVAIGNFSDEPMSLYRWREGTHFMPNEDSAGLAQATYDHLTFGVAFLDLDLDGVEDLVVVNGHIEPEIARFQSTRTHAQSAQIFQGLGDGTFRDVSQRAGPDFFKPRVGRGLAAGDVDGDGDLDLLITTNGGVPALLRNEAVEEHPHHFLRVKLEGKDGNKSALGARVRLTAGGVTQTRMARTGSSYLSQSESTLTFGLGKDHVIDDLKVTWPAGETRSYRVAEVDRTVGFQEE